MYVVSSDGTMNIVSNPGARCRFMSAIWYSYSKSLTARSPRISTFASTERAKSTSNPSKLFTSMRFSSATASRINFSRSSTVNTGAFPTLCATATMSRSTNPRVRVMRSS